MKKAKILVIGLGPGGGIFAGHLSASGYRVYGIDTWKEHIDEIRQKGLKIQHLTSIQTMLRNVGTDLDQFHEREFDYVIIAVKTPNMPEVAAGLKELPGNFNIVVLQNGLDNENYLASFFPKERILRVAVNYAGNIVSPGTIRMNFFQKPNRIGCICGQRDCTHAHEIARIMSDSALDTEVTGDIRKYTWKKAILNAILAPISALLGITMAQVMANSGTRNIVESLIRESIEVANAAGYDYGEDFFDHCVSFLLKAGEHKPSMLIDIENGNPTEIDYINGRIAYFGNRLNVPVPFNTTMTALVKAKEQYTGLF